MPQNAACCAHDHDCESSDCGPAWSLHTHIDTAKVRVLNQAEVSDLPPVQSWDLQANAAGDLEYPTQVSKFNGVHSLDLHFPDNFGADATQVNFIGLKGEFTEAKREAVIAVYEARAMPKDHQVPGMNSSAFNNIS
ncbi:hypothetical protein WJX73_004888 [Symbiochloris irregularis]|uniref:PITH domain-containing protein n=1 Tax=Symbiochloris irregularis TaxID=706552 RepID=A0AAW1NVF2_9CHLO